MRRVGHELTLGLQRLAQPRHQPVERARQLTELVVAVRIRRDRPCRAARSRRSGRHHGNRPQTHRREPEPAERGEQQRTTGIADAIAS